MFVTLILIIVFPEIQYHIVVYVGATFAIGCSMLYCLHDNKAALDLDVESAWPDKNSGGNTEGNHSLHSLKVVVWIKT